MDIARSVSAAAWNRRHPEEPFPFDNIAPRRLPRYLWDRSVIAVGRKRNVDVPWITGAAVRLLGSLLRRTDVGLEYGSGGSTIWFARRTRVLTTVEGFPSWENRLRTRLVEAGLRNVEVVLVPADEGRLGTTTHREAYVGVKPDLPMASLDYVFVDGEYRDRCALRAVDLLAPGGILVLDNANHYLPHASRTPLHVSLPTSPEWSQRLDRVRDWRLVWTTNGAWDTAIWIKTITQGVSRSAEPGNG